ncbi:preprotein translocase subunit SecG [Candidatus Campbellbacteria bacterium]|nr:MAG: preprotein translocase subunit SecG [Candidatus Campbellbacteria bacterium]
MEFITKILPTVQIVISVLLIISVLLQQTGAGLGAGFGGADSSNHISTRRGFEKTMLKFTTFLAILFFLTAVLALLVK